MSLWEDKEFTIFLPCITAEVFLETLVDIWQEKTERAKNARFVVHVQGQEKTERIVTFVTSFYNNAVVFAVRLYDEREDAYGEYFSPRIQVEVFDPVDFYMQDDLLLELDRQVGTLLGMLPTEFRIIKE